jgi:apolipoprotein N-acyltransferase
MTPRFRFILMQIALAVAAGVLLRLVVDLRPVWWLVWLAPAPLLLIAINFDARWIVRFEWEAFR